MSSLKLVMMVLYDVECHGGLSWANFSKIRPERLIQMLHYFETQLGVRSLSSLSLKHHFPLCIVLQICGGIGLLIDWRLPCMTSPKRSGTPSAQLPFIHPDSFQFLSGVSCGGYTMLFAVSHRTVLTAIEDQFESTWLNPSIRFVFVSLQLDSTGLALPAGAGWCRLDPGWRTLECVWRQVRSLRTAEQPMNIPWKARRTWSKLIKPSHPKVHVVVRDPWFGRSLSKMCFNLPLNFSGWICANGSTSLWMSVAPQIFFHALCTPDVLGWTEDEPLT